MPALNTYQVTRVVKENIRATTVQEAIDRSSFEIPLAADMVEIRVKDVSPNTEAKYT
jgi:hypothetical protein